MATCLIALGSNVGERAAVLAAAVDNLRNEQGVRVLRSSHPYQTQPVGGAALEGEFLNAAVLIETARAPEDMLDLLQRIETLHGRERRERWANRPLDLDLLLYGDRTIESPRLTLPHPRMSFRRFMLEPAAEIAPELIHPLIGWNLGQLLRHLDDGADCVAIVSPSESVRNEMTELFIDRRGATATIAPTDSEFATWWPPAISSWLSVPSNKASRIAAAPTYAPANHPKLTVLIDPPNPQIGPWGATVRLPGRGPTLHISAIRRDELALEVSAAMQAVWPHLGPSRS